MKPDYGRSSFRYRQYPCCSGCRWEALQQHKAIDKASIGRVSPFSENIKRNLVTFESLVAYELTTVEDEGNHTRLDKSSWLLAEPKV